MNSQTSVYLVLSKGPVFGGFRKSLSLEVGISPKKTYIYIMDFLKIEILNPKASQLLDDLAAMKLISIKREEPTDFYKFLSKLRSKSKGKISEDVITDEVQLVRKKRYAGKKTKSRH